MEERQAEQPEQPLPKNDGTELQPSKGQARRKKGVWYWMKRSFLAILLLFIALLLIIHIPAVQNWAAGKLTNFLSEEFQTKVELDYIRLGIFDSFILDNFYLEDKQGDTLVYAEELRIDLRRGLLSLLNKRLSIKEIDLRNARFLLSRKRGQTDMNIQFLIDYFSREEDLTGVDTVYLEPNPNALRLDISTLRLSDVAYIQKDSVRGQNLTGRIGRGTCHFRAIDLAQKRIEITSLTLAQPHLEINQYEWDSITLARLFPLVETPPIGPVYIKLDTTRLNAQIGQFKMMDGSFSFHNYWRAPERWFPPDMVDYNHLDIYDMQADFRNMQVEGLNFKGKVQQFQFKEQSGFVCENLTVGDGMVTDTLLVLNDLKIITPTSSIGDTLVMRYDEYQDFKDYVNQVYMIGNFHNARISVEDIMTFAPVLQSNAFFQKNRDEVVSLDGEIRGTVNSLGGNNLEIRLNEDTYVSGGFGSFGLAIPGVVSINPKIDRMSSSITTLRDLIPGFDPPATFDKLGRLQFSGRVDGFFSDLVIKGNLQTELGMVILDDIRFSLTGERATMRYSGGIDLINFELDRWTGNKDLGTITVSSEVIDGRGVTASTANAQLTAQIDSFFYKNYNYRDLEMNGKIEQNLFQGFLKSDDENINFIFDGTIDFTDNTPFFDFSANVKNLDLQRLNLLDDAVRIQGRIDLKIQDIRLDQLRGVVSMDDVQVTKDGKRHRLESLVAEAKYSDQVQSITLQSEVLDARISGQYNLESLPAELTYYLERNFPTYAKRFNILTESIPTDTSKFEYEVNVHDSKDLLKLFDPKFGRIGGMRIFGHFDPYKETALMDVELPRLIYGNVRMEDIILIINGEGSDGQVEFGVNSTQVGDNLDLQPALFYCNIYQDTVRMVLTVLDLIEEQNILEIDAQMFPDSNDFLLNFAQSKVVILNEVWEIPKNNLIRFGANYLQIRGFSLENSGRRVVLESQLPNGLDVNFYDFNIHLIDSLWAYEKLDFEGGLDLKAHIGDIYALEDLSVEAGVDSFLINEDYWGEMRLSAEAKNVRSPFDITFDLDAGDRALRATGVYNPPGLEKENIRNLADNMTPNNLDFSLTVFQYPLRMMEYFIGEAVSQTQGTANARIKVFGPPDKPEVSGTATVENVATTINYLNTRYFVDKHEVKINNTLFDASGARLTDERNHTGQVRGGITHDHLRNFGLDVQITADTFLVLNTTKEDNSLYYGTAIGRGDVRFSGSFAQPDIYVSASSGPGTKLFIPVSSEQEASEVRFIKWNQPKEKEENPEVASTEPLGVSVIMDLDIDEDASIEIVFDEQTGDILRGVGRGQLRLVVPRGQDFEMYGNYTVESGDYLFTLMNLFISKPFQVRRGGTIRWQGDPFAAQINIEAQYKDLKATLKNFISEYTVNSDLTAGADNNLLNQQVDVDLLMKLTGNLLQPDINFDIQFPNLTGVLKNYTDSKLRILRQDQNEMNRQVFGLIVVGDFIPTDFNIVGGGQIGIGINTVTEMLSQQLSLYLTELVSEWLVEDGLISGIDFDIAYNHVAGYDLSNLEDPTGVGQANELQVRLKNYLFDDRLSVNVGGNFDLGGQNVSGNPYGGALFAGDLVIEYVLTKDKNLKIRFYQSTEPDIGGRGYQAGLGLSYRKQFDTFGEFLQGLKITTKKIND